MAQVIKLANCTITGAEIIPRLARYRMLPQLLREILIDTAIATIELTSSDLAQAIAQFDSKHEFTSAASRLAWGERQGLSPEQLEDLALREPKIERFKQLTWGHRIESYFLTHKSKLDKVIYSLLRTTDAEVAQELFFRIQAGEQTFAECARSYSAGAEAQTGGLIGPVELSVPHPALAKMLAIATVGQLLPPTRLGEWFVIVRLEKLIGAQLDETMRQQLLDAMFEAWLMEQMQQVGIVEIQDSPTLVAL